MRNGRGGGCGRRETPPPPPPPPPPLLAPAFPPLLPPPHAPQGSPTPLSTRRETYRHSLAVTTERAGVSGAPFLYTLNLACPNELWGEVEEGFRQAVASFELLPPGSVYVAPDQDPWRFF